MKKGYALTTSSWKYFQVVVLGTPAEEGGQGKVYLLNGGAFDDVDAAIMAHPTNTTGALVTTDALSKVRKFGGI